MRAAFPRVVCFSPFRPWRTGVLEDPSYVLKNCRDPACAADSIPSGYPCAPSVVSVLPPCRNNSTDLLSLPLGALFFDYSVPAILCYVTLPPRP